MASENVNILPEMKDVISSYKHHPLYDSIRYLNRAWDILARDYPCDLAPINVPEGKAGACFNGLVQFSKEWRKRYIANEISRWKIEKANMESRVRREYRENCSSEDLQTQLVTLSIDNKLSNEDLKTNIDNIIKWFKGNRLTCLEEPVLRFEFYGENENWNPHAHIFTYRTMNNGRVACRLKASLKKLPCVYRVNVKDGTAQSQSQYILGTKKESKTMAMEMDQAFREKLNLNEIYNAVPKGV